jgi:hypothetical protein
MKPTKVPEVLFWQRWSAALSTVVMCSLIFGIALIGARTDIGQISQADGCKMPPGGADEATVSAMVRCAADNAPVAEDAVARMPAPNVPAGAAAETQPATF